MRDLAALLLLTLLGIGVTWAAVEGGDADTLVPPPESVAKAFVTHLEGRRYGPAAELTAEGSCGLDEERLRAASVEMRQRFPGVQHVDAEETTHLAETSIVAVTLQQRGGREAVVPVRLVREQGDWAVQCFDLPVAAGASRG